MASISRQAEIIDAYALIREQVIDMLEERRIPLGGEVDQVREVVQEVVRSYQARAHLGSGRALADPAVMAQQVLSFSHRLWSAGRVLCSS